MTQRLLAIAFLLGITVTGCAPANPRWREDAQFMLNGVRLGGADKEFPAEYGSVEDAYTKGEALLKEDEVEDADEYFRLAWTKGSVLTEEIAEQKVRRAEEARRKAEAERLELERQRAIMEEQSKVILEKEELEVKKTVEKAGQLKERQLPASHTVKHGETLPQIAARSDVYNDYKLWPLLYRANRDQIRDPKHIWPGQVLRIPRNLSREEMNEARRYAQEKPIH